MLIDCTSKTLLSYTLGQGQWVKIWDFGYEKKNCISNSITIPIFAFMCRGHFPARHVLILKIAYPEWQIDYFIAHKSFLVNIQNLWNSILVCTLGISNSKGVGSGSGRRGPAPQYIYHNSKLLASIVCFAKLFKTSLWAVWAEQHTLHIWFLP